MRHMRRLERQRWEEAEEVTTQGQGPLNDPRLIERRGDLSGLNAALFVILVIVAFAAAAYLVATVLHIGGSGTSPSPSIAAASGSPSSSAAATSSAAPSGSPSPTPRASPPATSAAIGQPINVTVGQHVVGTVTVVSVQYPKTVVGKAPGSGVRWAAVRVRYQATGNLLYDTKDWSIVDANGTQYAWAGVDFKPGIGRGSLKAGGKLTGNVTFKVPLQGTFWAVFAGLDGPHRVQLPAQ